MSIALIAAVGNGLLSSYQRGQQADKEADAAFSNIEYLKQQALSSKTNYDTRQDVTQNKYAALQDGVVGAYYNGGAGKSGNVRRSYAFNSAVQAIENVGRREEVVNLANYMQEQRKITIAIRNNEDAFNSSTSFARLVSDTAGAIADGVSTYKSVKSIVDTITEAGASKTKDFNKLPLQRTQNTPSQDSNYGTSERRTSNPGPVDSFNRLEQNPGTIPLNSINNNKPLVDSKPPLSTEFKQKPTKNIGAGGFGRDIRPWQDNVGLKLSPTDLKEEPVPELQRPRFQPRTKSNGSASFKQRPTSNRPAFKKRPPANRAVFKQRTYSNRPTFKARVPKKNSFRIQNNTMYNHGKFVGKVIDGFVVDIYDKIIGQYDDRNKTYFPH